MTSINPGPASTSNPNSVAVLTPANTLTNPGPQGANALRLLAVGRAVTLATTGDVAVLPVINAAAWIPATVITTNSGTAVPDVHTAALGIWTGASQGGTNVIANGTLASQTTSAYAKVQATAAGAATRITAQYMYVNVGTALANATVDIFVYGYDAS